MTNRLLGHDSSSLFALSSSCIAIALLLFS